MNVLLVDDEPLVIQDIAASIHWSSIGVRHVLLAYSASQAMEKFEEYDIGLIICDVEMPHINGLQLLAWVKEHSPNTRSIILTCHPLFDYAKEAIHLNCIDYILKPIDTDALEELLKKSVGELLRTSPLRTQEVFWKNCAEGAYPDASSLPAVAKQYGISSETAAYVTVSIYFTNLEKRCLDDSGMYQSLLTAVSGSFSDTEFHHLFFLDNTHTIFGIFSAAPEELAPLAASICHRLEAQRYFMHCSDSGIHRYPHCCPLIFSPAEYCKTEWNKPYPYYLKRDRRIKDTITTAGFPLSQAGRGSPPSSNPAAAFLHFSGTHPPSGDIDCPPAGTGRLVLYCFGLPGYFSC